MNIKCKNKSSFKWNSKTKKSLVTCQSLVVQQVKEDDGDPRPREDQSHDQQPGHWGTESHDDFVQKRSLIGSGRRDRPSSVSLAAHWCGELRAEGQQNNKKKGKEREMRRAKNRLVKRGIKNSFTSI